MARYPYEGSTGIAGAASRLIIAWAMLGGFLLLVVVGINMLTVIGSMFGKPFPGDFELTEIGVGVAVFAFLPYCQLVGANVSADIFTANASRRVIAFFMLMGSIVALGFSLLLLSRMYLGMLDQKAYDYTTAILQFPHWIAFIPILMSLALLALAALLTLTSEFKVLSKG